jgi:hypothetical protein
MHTRILIVSIYLAVCYTADAAQTLVYTKETGGVEITTTYTVDQDHDQYHVQGANKDQTTEILSAIPYKALSFSYTSKKNSDQYTFVLKEATLTADGIVKGEKLHAVYKIARNSAWIQEFEFGFLPFLTSNKKSLDFDILHPKNFKLHKMTAKKHKIETLRIGEASYQAQMVTITLQGFKSMFWKAQLWYDTVSHNLLMYKANEGPHTPTTTISLTSKTESLE